MVAYETTLPVLVGVDGSESALRAANWAAAEASVRKAPLALMHAFDIPDAPRLADPDLRARYRAAMLRQARQWLREAAGVARSVNPGLELSEELSAGHPVDLLAKNSARAQLVVLGNQGRSGLYRVLTGSVAVGVCARAHAPVVVVRHAASALSDAGLLPGTGTNAPVVVGVDGSLSGEPALTFAFEYAAAHHAPLIAIHSWGSGCVDPGSGTIPEAAHAAEEEGRYLLAERLAGWGEKYPEVTVHRVVEAERPAAALLAATRGARLVVVGSRGRGGFLGWVLGSTSQALLHRAECPVAVVRSLSMWTEGENEAESRISRG